MVDGLLDLLEPGLRLDPRATAVQLGEAVGGGLGLFGSDEVIWGLGDEEGADDEEAGPAPLGGEDISEGRFVGDGDTGGGDTGCN